MSKIKAIDFFCGAGGLTRGLLNAGIKVLAGVDNDERLKETYTYNNKPSRLSIRILMQLTSTNYAKNWEFKTKIQRFMLPAHHANRSLLLTDRTWKMMTEKYCF